MKKLWMAWGIINVIGLGLGCLLLLDVITISSTLGKIICSILLVIAFAPLIIIAVGLMAKIEGRK